jgi:nitrogen-specific signal transduction histidine kinase
MEFSVSTGSANGKPLGFSLASKLYEALGTHATVLTEQPHKTAFALRLPAIPVAGAR